MVLSGSGLHYLLDFVIYLLDLLLGTLLAGLGPCLLHIHTQMIRLLVVQIVLSVLALLALAAGVALHAVIIALAVFLQAVGLLAVAGPLPALPLQVGPQSKLILAVVLAAHALAQLVAPPSLGEALAVIFGTLGFQAVAPLEYLRRLLHHAPRDVDRLLLLALVLQIPVSPAQVDLLKALLRISLVFLLDGAHLFALCLHFPVHVLVLRIVLVVDLIKHALALVQLFLEAALLLAYWLLFLFFGAVRAALLVILHIIINFWRFREFKAACSAPPTNTNLKKSTRTIDCSKSTSK